MTAKRKFKALPLVIWKARAKHARRPEFDPQTGRTSHKAPSKRESRRHTDA